MKAVRERIVGLAFTVAGLAVLGAPAPLAAQEAPGMPTPTSVTVKSFSPSDPELSTQLVATLTSVDGGTVAGATVSFYLEKELLGTRFAGIGSATTDATGTARVAYVPRRSEESIRVVFAGDSDHAAVTIDAAVPFLPERVVAVSIPHHVHGLLSPIRNTMPILIMGGVAVLWVFLIGLVVSTVRRIRRTGAASPAEEATHPLIV